MCGFVGMISSRDVAAELHIALQALQHRGQDSAGIATMSADGDEFHMRRNLGLVTQALGPDDIDDLVGNVGIAHVRYPTIGRGVLADAQPFFYRQPGVLMAHNGNITNYKELRESLAERSIHLMSHCDVEPVLCEFSDALMRRAKARHTLDDAIFALREVQQRVRGSYSIVTGLMLDGQPTMLLVRDPNGIRPAVIGRRDDGSWLAASESTTLDALGFKIIDDPRPGEVVVLRAGQEPIRIELDAREPTPCIFEYIYFARPDSVIDGRSVYEVRLALGRSLARRIREKGIEADVVIPVPDTARPAAATLAEMLSLPLREGFIKNRYSGRTFIMPDQLTRTTALRLKLNTLPREIQGRRVLLVDDSIVRGTTLKRVISLLEDAGAASVHLAIHSPPVRFPCFYGIDMSTEEELFARRFPMDLDTLEQQAAAHLGADSLTYLSVAGMNESFAGPRCGACFDGQYPQPLTEHDQAAIVGDRRIAATESGARALAEDIIPG